VPRIEGEFVPLEVGDVDILPDPAGDVESDVVTVAAMDRDKQRIQWSLQYRNQSQIESAEAFIQIVHADNDSVVLYRAAHDTVSNITETVALTKNQSKEDWVIKWSVAYVVDETGELTEITRDKYLGGVSDLNVPVSSTFLQVVSILSLLLLAGLFGGRLSSIGGIVVVATAWLLRAVGFLSVPVEFLIAATVIAVFLRLGTVKI